MLYNTETRSHNHFGCRHFGHFEPAFAALLCVVSCGFTRPLGFWACSAVVTENTGPAAHESTRTSLLLCEAGSRIGTSNSSDSHHKRLQSCVSMMYTDHGK